MPGKRVKETPAAVSSLTAASMSFVCHPRMVKRWGLKSPAKVARRTVPLSEGRLVVDKGQSKLVAVEGEGFVFVVDGDEGDVRCGGEFCGHSLLLRFGWRDKDIRKVVFLAAIALVVASLRTNAGPSTSLRMTTPL